MNSAVFLDRDGVIVENRPSYIRQIADIEFFPQALIALQKLSTTRNKIIIVTNQSVIGRGIISLGEAIDINNYILKQIEKDLCRIDGIYLCPHTPEDMCACRKPLPGMIRQAAVDLDIDLKSSILIGDALSDIQAGKSAEISTNVLVRTGLGQAQFNLNDVVQSQPFHLSQNLLDAVDALIPY